MIPVILSAIIKVKFLGLDRRNRDDVPYIL